MNYVWETELMPIYGTESLKEWKELLHLKKAWKSADGRDDPTYKVSVAWIGRTGKRKWVLTIVNDYTPINFSTLKAAKAYAVAIATLES